MATGRKREGRPPAEKEDYDGDFDVEGKSIRGVKGAESVRKEPSTEKGEPKFCLSSAETAMQMVSRGARKEA